MNWGRKKALMKGYLGSLIFTVIMLAIFPGKIAQGQIAVTDEQLWEVTFEEYLKDPLWIERDAYDAGHFLMVALHSAFLLDKRDWIEAFHEQIAGFLRDGQEDYGELAKLSKVHYLYFLSQYLVLEGTAKEQYLMPESLPDFIHNELSGIWYQTVWRWNGGPFPGGMGERLIWKLETEDVEYEYYRGITDLELFAFAIAADLKAYNDFNSPNDGNSMLSEILEIAYRVFEQRGEFQADGGWVFEPGVWAEHPDYAYAGHEFIAPDLEEKIVPDIAWDSSHFARFPLWLNSILNACSRDSRDYDLYLRTKCALAEQFHNIVLVPPTGDFGSYRTTNYMDGRNGVYRYSHATQGEGNGYGPWELSGKLLQGWWIFLDSGKEHEVYSHIAEQFPLSQEVMDLYLGPGTTRDRHPLIKGTAQYTSGILELISRLAARIAQIRSEKKLPLICEIHVNNGDSMPWDIDRNGVVDVRDLAIVGSYLGEEISPGTYPNPDVNRDGDVNILDLVLVGRHFGEEYSDGLEG